MNIFSGIESRYRRRPRTLLDKLILWAIIILAIASVASYFNYSINTILKLNTVEVFQTERTESLRELDGVHAYSEQFALAVLEPGSHTAVQSARDNLTQTFFGRDKYKNGYAEEMSAVVLVLSQLDDLYASAEQREFTIGERAALSFRASVYLEKLDIAVHKLVSKHLDNDLNDIVQKTRDQFTRSIQTLVIFFGFLLAFGVFAIRKYRESAQQMKENRNEHKELEFARRALEESRASLSQVNNLSINENDYLAAANHELRTPLTSIIGYIQILKAICAEESERNSEVSKYLDVMERNSEALLEIVDDILTISRIESQQLEDKKEEVNVAEELRNLFDANKSILEARNMPLRFLHDKFSYMIYVDKFKFHHLIRNIYTNALKYNKLGAAITVKLENQIDARGQDCVSISFTDQGRGIPEEDIPRIFDKFFRASNSDLDGTRGTGLGLAVAKVVTDQCGGTLSVESTVGVGSTFTILIPSLQSETQKFVNANRARVLQKAIDAVSNSNLEDLRLVVHEHAGAVGFYDYPGETEALHNFSLWLADNQPGNDQLALSKKEEILTMLRSSMPNSQATQAN